MANWDLKRKERISHLLGDTRWLNVGVDSIEGKATAFSVQELSGVELVIGYDSYTDLYFAWNPFVHNWHKGKRITLKCGITLTTLRKKNFEAILPIYRRMKYGMQVEKLVIVKPHYIDEFCAHFNEYLLPNPSDESFNPAVVYADKSNTNARKWTDLNWPDSYVHREYQTCKRLERDSCFRRNCLQAYNYCCVICGCRTEKLLEAAHIVAVRDGGTDDVTNSVCLCANHHRLYDANLLQIDLENGVFYCLCSTEKTMPWYLAAKKNNYRLFHRKTHQD